MTQHVKRARWISLRGGCSAVAAAILLCALTGCVHRRMTVRSNPPGAYVYIDDYPIGITPVSTSFTYYGKRKFRLVRDGYETLTVEQKIKTPWYEWFGLDFVSENLIPYTIRDEQQLNFQMVPQQVPQREQLASRAEELRASTQAQRFVPPPTLPPAGAPGAPAPIIVPTQPGQTYPLPPPAGQSIIMPQGTVPGGVPPAGTYPPAVPGTQVLPPATGQPAYVVPPTGAIPGAPLTPAAPNLQPPPASNAPDPYGYWGPGAGTNYGPPAANNGAPNYGPAMQPGYASPPQPSYGPGVQPSFVPGPQGPTVGGYTGTAPPLSNP